MADHRPTINNRSLTARAGESHLTTMGVIVLAETMRTRLRQRETLFGAWTTTSDVVVVGAVAAAGFDYVVIDLQHGTASESSLPGLCAAIRLAGAVAIARTRSPSFADVGRALDLGAQGVIVPNVDDDVHAAAVVRAVRYPPAGARSQGRVHADDSEPLCFVMVESRSAMEALPATVQLAGIDGIYVGPADLSRSLGCSPTYGDAVFAATVSQIVDTCAKIGVPVGVHDPIGTEVDRNVAAGCQLINTLSDLPALTRLALAARRGRAAPSD
jgi:4-hydroxy-2-oxoheptanedioate aldolase